MPHAQNDHGIVDHPIAQDIRPDRRHLPPPAADIAAALGKRRQTIGDRDQAVGQGTGSGWVERRNIGEDRLQIGDRIVRPDDAQLLADAWAG